MEFLNGILVKVSVHKLESFHARVFARFLPAFLSFYKMMNRLEFSFFVDFFVRIIKTRVKYGFL